MSQFQVLLFGFKGKDSNVKLVRIPKSEIAKASAFMLMFKKSPQDKFENLFDSPILFPSSIKSAKNKKVYIDSEILFQELVLTYEEEIVPIIEIAI